MEKPPFKIKPEKVKKDFQVLFYTLTIIMGTP